MFYGLAPADNRKSICRSTRIRKRINDKYFIYHYSPQSKICHVIQSGIQYYREILSICITPKQIYMPKSRTRSPYIREYAGRFPAAPTGTSGRFAGPPLYRYNSGSRLFFPESLNFALFGILKLRSVQNAQIFILYFYTNARLFTKKL